MRPRPRPFVVLAKARNESKWLVELLDGHLEPAACGETFGGDHVDHVPREDVVANIDDVRAVLAGTRFASMLRDPRRAQSAHAVL